MIRDDVRNAWRGAQLLGAAIGGLATAVAAQAREPWPEPEAVAIHWIAEHPGPRGIDLELATPGVGLRWRTASAGAYHNSFDALTVYATRRWRLARYGRLAIDIDTGIATGYRDAPWSSSDAVPLAAATAAWREIAITYAPSPDGGAVLFSTRFDIDW